MYETAVSTYETSPDLPGSTMEDLPLDGFDPSFDPTARPAPIPDGEYPARLIGETGEWTRSAKGFWRRITCEIVEGQYAGRRLQALVSTAVNKQGSSSAAQIAYATGNASSLQDARSHSDICSLIDEILAGDPLVIIRTRWEAREKTVDGQYITLIRGQRNFPPFSNGTGTNHQVRPSTEGGTVYVDAAVSGFRKITL